MLRPASWIALAVVLLPTTVHAFDHHHSHHHGSSHGGGCGSTSSHTTVASSPPSSGSAPGTGATATNHKVVFVTSATSSGAIGGLTAADAHCQASASAQGLTGPFRAWLSDGKTDAIDRVTGVGPWYTTHGVRAFASKASLVDAPETDLLDESGAPLPRNAAIWSGSEEDGTASTHHCSNWSKATGDVTATTGSALASDPAWGGGDAPLPCSAVASLICFQQ